jgi:hypothetical protein
VLQKEEKEFYTGLHLKRIIGINFRFLPLPDYLPDGE